MDQIPMLTENSKRGKYGSNPKCDQKDKTESTNTHVKKLLKEVDKVKFPMWLENIKRGAHGSNPYVTWK